MTCFHMLVTLVSAVRMFETQPLTTMKQLHDDDGVRESEKSHAHPMTMDKTSEMREEPSAACSDGGCEESLAEVDAFEASPLMDALDAAIQARGQIQEEA